MKLRLIIACYKIQIAVYTKCRCVEFFFFTVYIDIIKFNLTSGKWGYSNLIINAIERNEFVFAKVNFLLKWLEQSSPNYGKGVGLGEKPINHLILLQPLTDIFRVCVVEGGCAGAELLCRVRFKSHQLKLNWSWSWDLTIARKVYWRHPVGDQCQILTQSYFMQNFWLPYWRLI